MVEGQFDITGIVGEQDGVLFVTRTDMNHATEVYSLALKTKDMRQVTHVNDKIYNSLAQSRVEPHWIKTTDEKICWFGLYCHQTLIRTKISVFAVLPGWTAGSAQPVL